MPSAIRKKEVVAAMKPNTPFSEFVAILDRRANQNAADRSMEKIYP
jgi:hypothetical protein